MTEKTEVLFEMVKEHVAMVTINRPKMLNSINMAASQGLKDAIDRIESDDNIRAAVFTGAGDKAFCTGADLAEANQKGTQELSDFVESPMFSVYFGAHKKPFIAAVRGFALGGGLELALVCDMIVAGESAHFGVPEVKVGYAAVGGGFYRLARVIPKNVALEMIGTGDPIDAARAKEVGLINKVVPDDQVLSDAIALAVKISKNAPLSVQESLGVARIAEDLDLDAFVKKNQEVFVKVFNSEDAKEGVAAFVEKRSPSWTGR